VALLFDGQMPAPPPAPTLFDPLRGSLAEANSWPSTRRIRADPPEPGALPAFHSQRCSSAAIGLPGDSGVCAPRRFENGVVSTGEREIVPEEVERDPRITKQCLATSSPKQIAKKDLNRDPAARTGPGGGSARLETRPACVRPSFQAPHL